jgi:diguanylate cyclase (GGDEF)-like protein
MQVTQEILLPVLLAAIVVNTVILVLVIGRFGGRGRMASTRSALEGSLMSTSYIDRSGSASWPSNGGTMAESVEPEPDDEEAGPADDAASSWDDGLEPTDAEPSADEPDGVEAAAGSEAAPGVDVLTGLPGPGAFTRLIAAEDLRVQRYHRAATVVIFELGGLDRLIDRLGTEAADRVVPALADTMRRLARDVDDVARLAPGRFGVLLPETDEVAAINYVERVRRACELWLESGAIALSLAAGWAGTSGDPTLVEAQRLATDRMYLELRREHRRAAAEG